MLRDYFRNAINKRIIDSSSVVLRNINPTRDVLSDKFKHIHELGIYLHIPFCEQICPYCPYNKEIYSENIASRYKVAVKKEIDYYSDIIGQRQITSFYIGGGTPTTMLYSGIEDILAYIFDRFNMQCEIHMESHPRHLNSENLNELQSLGVTNLSVGIEALQDRHLRFLKRPYTAQEAKEGLQRAVNYRFSCVNADLIFALPDQTRNEIAEAGKAFVDIGVDQIATYPLFRFPYTVMGNHNNHIVKNNTGLLKRRRMLAVLEDIFYNAGYERSSVWAFTKRGTQKYCSVTVPLYVGLGASGSSYLRDIFYLNTFNVAEYINAIEQERMATALSVDLSDKMQMAGWLYWRVYETRFEKKDFNRRFLADFDHVYGKYIKLLARIGFLKDDGERIILSDRGTYWLHAFEDFFSIDYISKLWGTSKQNPWPEKVVL